MSVSFATGQLCSAPLRLPLAMPPLLMVVVDTEEEFEWGTPPQRQGRAVAAMAEIGRAQELFEQFGLIPTYVVDYPVVEQAAGWAPLAPLAAAGRCLIGAHLHPWVNPPLSELLTPAHTYPGNLPPDLEQAKLAALRARLTERLGQPPLIYKAGRYGLGPRSADLLAAAGFRVDLSLAPGFDFSADGGPDYRHASNHPCWLWTGDAWPAETVLALPTTGGWIGALADTRWETAAERLAATPWGRRGRIGGVLSRLRLLARVRLSPEGFDWPELQRLTGALLQLGVRLFTLSLHSPSLKPGCTPYVRDLADRERLLGVLRRYCAYFMTQLGGRPTTPLAVHGWLTGGAAP